MNDGSSWPHELDAEETIEEAESRRRVQRRPKKRVRNERFPEHLPRYEKIVDLPDEQKAGKTFIGYDEVETVEFERARLRDRVTKYAKYADPRQPRQGSRGRLPTNNCVATTNSGKARRFPTTSGFRRPTPTAALRR